MVMEIEMVIDMMEIMEMIMEIEMVIDMIEIMEMIMEIEMMIEMEMSVIYRDDFLIFLNVLLLSKNTEI